MESVPDNGTPILVVDDDIGLLSSIKATIVGSGMPEPALISDSRHVMRLVRTHTFHLVLLDLIMPHMNGMEVLQQLKKEFPAIECIVVTAVDEVSSSVQAMKYGAYDYLVKPLSPEKMLIIINRALEKYTLRHGLTLFEKSQTFTDLKNPKAFQNMVAEDESMALIFRQAEAVAPTDYNLVITGESGTGKEMLARIIHTMSNRSEGPFFAVNMAASSNPLFDTEFFGHTKGAFTGAVTEKEGFFEAAQGGTLFLDEITELESCLQGKLLRVIQESELYRLGSTIKRNVDARIIASSNRYIEEEVESGRFRGDLFYRLNTFRINIPPLRERKKDILPLANHFLRIYAIKNQKKILSLEPEFEDFLIHYSFPGNVRELENIIASSVLLGKGRILSLSSVQGLNPLSETIQVKTDRMETLKELEKKHIFHVLDGVNGNRTRAAKILGIGLRTLQRKLKAFESDTTMLK